MIWIDASFAVEWLFSTMRVANISLPATEVAMPSHQYAEVLAYFYRQHVDVDRAIKFLSPLQIIEPNRLHLQEASLRYVQARRSHPRCKVSLADAILATMSQSKDEILFSFDQDFRYLALEEFEKARWRTKKL